MLDFLLGNDALSAVIAFVLVLVPAVLIHELGHFIAAKLVGITILEFGIGMPPRMLKLFTYKGTDYTLNWLPLGGFVRPLGEDLVRQVGDEALEEDRSEARARGIEHAMSVNEAKPLARIFFMAGGALANFLMAFVLFTIIAMTGIPEVVGARVNVLATGSAVMGGDLRAGDVIETVNGQRFADLGAFIGLIQQSPEDEVELRIWRAGVDEPFTVRAAFADLSDLQLEPHPLIRGVASSSPAQRAGILPGDIVLAFNGENIATFEELQARTREHLGQSVTLTLWRSGEIVEASLVPRANPPQGQGAMGIEIGAVSLDPALGLAIETGVPQRELVPQPLPAAMRYAIDRIAGVFQTIASIPSQIIQGTASPESLRLTSPLGISQVGAVFLQESIQQDQPSIVLEFIALISIALGLTNLLPIPALDGGRILFVVIELIRGKPIAPEREGMVHLVGLALLLSLMVVVLLNDIANPLTDMLR